MVVTWTTQDGLWGVVVRLCWREPKAKLRPGPSRVAHRWAQTTRRSRGWSSRAARPHPH
jgi:hypothetical protein